MSFNVAKREMIAKREATAGTKESVVDADFDVRMRQVEFTPDIQGGDEDSKFVTGDYGEDISISGIRGATFNTMTKLATASAIDSAPKWGKLAEGCGLVGTQYLATGYGYEPLQSGDKQTLSFYKVDISDDGTPVGIQSSCAGVMGNLTLSAEGVGSPIMLNYEFKGKFDGIADVPNGSILSLTSPDTTIGAKFMNGTATIGGVSYCVQSFNFNTGNTIEYLPCPSEATGILTSTIVNRQPRMTITLLAPTATSYNPFSNVTTENTEEVVLTFGDWTLTIPVAQVLSYSESELNGRLAYELSIKCLRNAGANASLQDESTFQLLQGATA